MNFILRIFENFENNSKGSLGTHWQKKLLTVHCIQIPLRRVRVRVLGSVFFLARAWRASIFRDFPQQKFTPAPKESGKKNKDTLEEKYKYKNVK